MFYCTAEMDQIGSDIGNTEAEAGAPIVEGNSPPADLNPEGNKPDTRLEESTTTSKPPPNSMEHQPPSSPMMDLEADFPSGETSGKLNPLVAVVLHFCINHLFTTSVNDIN